MLNFNHLYYFHVVAAEGSIKAAAERLGVTQPTVSEQLRLLERSLGVELFERTPSGPKLTAAGCEASEHAASMFLTGERLVKALGGGGHRPEVTLRVGVSASMARAVAADFLMPVLSVADCRPSIHTSEFNEMMRDLRGRDLDLVIGETEPADLGRAGLSVQLICRPHLVCVAPPEIEPKEDWHNLSLLAYRASSAYRWEVDSHLHVHGKRPTIMAELDDAFLMLEGALRGGFIAFVPGSIAKESIKAGRLKALATLEPHAAGIYAVYPENDTLQLARVAVERLMESANQSPDDG